MIFVALSLLSPLALADEPPQSESASQFTITTIFTDLGIADFRVRKTKHFVIGHDTSEEFLRPHIVRLEGIYAAVSSFCEMNGFKPKQSDELLPIVFFDTFAAFTRYAEMMRMPSEGIAGFYHQKNNVAAFVNASDYPSIRAIADKLDLLHKQLAEARDPKAPAADPATADALQNLTYSVARERDAIIDVFNSFVLQHEAAHQVLYNAGVHVRGAATPQWLVEGLACQFEMPQIDRSGKLRRVNKARLADLREAMGLGQSSRRDVKVDVSQLIADGYIIPLKQLVSGDGVFTDADARLKLSYAQGWSLVLYLHRTSPGALRAYLQAMSKREPGGRADPERDLAEFEAAFSPIDEEFEQSWADFVVRLPLEP